MAKSSDYYKELREQKKIKLRELESQLPRYCLDYLDEKELTSQINTVISYAYDLITFMKFLIDQNPLCKDLEPKDISLELLDGLTFHDINEYQKYLSLSCSKENPHENEENGIARRMSALRGFYKFACQHEYLKNNPTLGAAKRPKKKKDAIIRMESDEVHNMLHTVKSSNMKSQRQKKFCEKNQQRDTAILTLFLNTGMRVSELVGLDIKSLNFSQNTVFVIRKGAKSNILYFNEQVAETLKDYIDGERASLLGPNAEEQALFLSNRKQRMCVKAVENVVKKFAQEAVPDKHITPHKLRSTYGTALYRETGDIKLVADVLGHEDVNTTNKYYAASEEEHRKMAAKIKVYEQK